MRSPIVHVRTDQNHMATTFRFVVSCPEARARAASRVLADAQAEVARLEGLLSEFRPDSPVARLNEARAHEPVALPIEAIELLERSERLRERTQGAFDCAAKSASRPSEGACVAWDRERLLGWKLHDGVRVGFGAIGKGYALDRVRTLVVAQGFQDFVLSAGGSSIVLSGFAAPGEPWRWGWSWGRDADGDAVGIPLSHPTGAQIAIGVSGTHEKGRHLIDARAGAGRPSLPAASVAGAQPRSALVATASAADADAFSTALFVAGYEETARLLQDLPTSIALAQIDAKGVPRWNGIFRQRWGGIPGDAASFTSKKSGEAT